MRSSQDTPCPTCGEGIAAKQFAQLASCPTCDAPLIVCESYRLISLLGSGGMSRVYSARHASTGEQAAVKLLANSDQKQHERRLFETSSRLLLELTHPQLPQVYSFEQDNRGQLLLVREPFFGGTLWERLMEWGCAIDSARFRDMLDAMLDLLVYLHARIPPIIHRDIKPSNIMFRTPDDWDPVLVDFDTVTPPVAAADALDIVVTPGYASPEQMLGEVVPASDLVGLASTMVFVATRSEPAELARGRDSLDVEHWLSHCDPALRRVLAKMLEPSLSKRYQSAREAMDDLRGIEVAPNTLITPSSTQGVMAPTPGTLVESGVIRPGPNRPTLVEAAGPFIPGTVVERLHTAPSMIGPKTVIEDPAVLSHQRCPATLVEEPGGDKT